jgi:hypothetical protein
MFHDPEALHLIPEDLGQDVKGVFVYTGLLFVFVQSVVLFSGASELVFFEPKSRRHGQPHDFTGIGVWGTNGVSIFGVGSLA